MTGPIQSPAQTTAQRLSYIDWMRRPLRGRTWKSQPRMIRALMEGDPSS